ncbi:LysR family substrate-binding domain-containing protein [Georgenia ruanii]|uniref:LysR family transcriptional regulator n=1 Tax=Georgenia ruanii TaxID=348442 RepID=A0A7J9UX87_9MICO|nr:LysR family substrate-binding domain-containing protein [Georgenia ruanii]MPV88983.1 LysR family transcriptional regulator [Georgenia ruanii]
MADPFRIRFVPGVTPDKWLRRWDERYPDAPLEASPVDEAEQVDVLHDGAAAMCFVRLPVDRAGLHLIPLYREAPVVVAAKDHPVAAFDEVDVADLADEHLLQDPAAVPEWAALATEVRAGTRVPVPPMTAKQAIEVAASGAGVVILPLSVARLHHRKDVVHRAVRGVAESQVGLAWREDDDDPRLEAFIGVVRGRTARSTRGGGVDPAESPAGKGRGSAARGGREGASRAGRGRSAGAGRGGNPRGKGQAGRRRGGPGRRGR